MIAKYFCGSCWTTFEDCFDALFCGKCGNVLVCVEAEPDPKPGSVWRVSWDKPGHRSPKKLSP